MMLTQRSGVLITHLFEQAGRAFDVGEEKGDRTGWLRGSARPRFRAFQQPIIEGAGFRGGLDSKIFQ